MALDSLAIRRAVLRRAGLRPRRRRQTAAPIRFMARVRTAYFQQLRDLILEASEALELEVGSIEAVARRAQVERADALNDDLLAVTTRLRDRISGVFTRSRVQSIATNMAQDLSSRFERRFQTQMRQLGVIADSTVGRARVQTALETAVTDSVALIGDLGRSTAFRVEQTIIRNVREGNSATDIARELRSVLRSTARRAELIANDQVGKLQGAINEARQRSMGVTHYIWQTQRDERVRDEHRKRQGEQFAWNNPPPDGHPGQPVNCRCVAVPVLPD